MAKQFLCFNCKPRSPKCGDGPWEITLTTVTILLFILSIVEIIALAQYSSVYSQSEVSACCGVIKEKSYTADGAICFETDIKDSHIEKDKMDDGSVFCVINDEICDVFNYPADEFTLSNVTDLENQLTQGNFTTDLETCLTDGGFDLADVCGEELLNEAAAHTAEGAQSACVILCIVIFSITFFGICEYIGCFENSCYCQNKAVNIINKLLEIFIWIILLIVQQTVIENTAQNGYFTRWPPSSDARKYLYDVCSIDRKSVMWVDFTLNMPDWLNSPGYQAVAGIGVALSIIEFLLFFIVFHNQRIFAKKSGTSTDDQENVKKSIEMGTNEKNKNEAETLNTGDTNDKTTELETAEPTGNEDIGGSYRESDDDVLYDDEEKEMEYITPGGPDGDTPGGPDGDTEI